jgi:hypothetical protein
MPKDLHPAGPPIPPAGPKMRDLHGMLSVMAFITALWDFEGHVMEFNGIVMQFEWNL